jgi:hypothetical protein
MAMGNRFDSKQIIVQNLIQMMRKIDQKTFPEDYSDERIQSDFRIVFAIEKTIEHYSLLVQLFADMFADVGEKKSVVMRDLAFFRSKVF